MCQYWIILAYLNISGKGRLYKLVCTVVWWNIFEFLSIPFKLVPRVLTPFINDASHRNRSRSSRAAFHTNQLAKSDDAAAGANAITLTSTSRPNRTPSLSCRRSRCERPFSASADCFCRCRWGSAWTYFGALCSLKSSAAACHSLKRRYINKQERTKLAAALGLRESQVKWFQCIYCLHLTLKTYATALHHWKPAMPLIS